MVARAIQHLQPIRRFLSTEVTREATMNRIAKKGKTNNIIQYWAEKHKNLLLLFQHCGQTYAYL